MLVCYFLCRVHYPFELNVYLARDNILYWNEPGDRKICLGMPDGTRDEGGCTDDTFSGYSMLHRAAEVLVNWEFETCHKGDKARCAGRSSPAAPCKTPVDHFYSPRHRGNSHGVLGPTANVYGNSLSTVRGATSGTKPTVETRNISKETSGCDNIGLSIEPIELSAAAS